LYLKQVNTGNFLSGAASLLLAVGITAGRFPNLLGWYRTECPWRTVLHCRKYPVTSDVSCVGLVCCLAERWAVVAPTACCIGVALLHLMGMQTELVSSRPLEKQGTRKD